MTETTLQSALEQGRQRLAKLKEEAARAKSVKEEAEQSRHARAVSFLFDSIANILPDYLFEFVPKIDQIDPNFSKIDTRYVMKLQPEGFAPIRFYFHKYSGAAETDNLEWKLEGFRVATLKTNTAYYYHLQDYAPVHVQYKFEQSENFFKVLEDLPLALAIAEENGTNYAKAERYIDERGEAEGAWQEQNAKAQQEQKEIQELEQEAENIMFEDQFLNIFRDFILKTVDESVTTQ